ncbi:MAG: hypothetical protein QOJ12_305 [Thermoleophilales bacterium]|nr:hypothetical protein [Thermoleophilales bacterium]
MQRWRRAVWLSDMVDERARFVARELLPRAATDAYRLRDDTGTVIVRHRRDGGSRDAFVLHEVVRGGDYDLPADVVAALADAARPLRVVDLGANVGYFTLRLLGRYPDAHVVAFEPDRSNVAVLRAALRRNGVERGVEIIEACAATADGSVGFIDGLECESRVALDGEAAAATVPALDVFPYLDGADLVKIDIEGSEWDLLADPRLGDALPRVIVLEYHSARCPAENAKRAAADRLTGLGYEVRHAQPDAAPDSGPFWGAGVIWAVSPRPRNA